MAKKEAKASLCPFLLTIVFLCCYSDGNKELDLLLSLRASINDPLNHLSDWNSSFSSLFCEWHGVSCDNGSRVVSIRLSGHNISGQLSSSAFQLSYLQSLDLSDNQLMGKIPDNIFSCSSLRFLNLSNNNLSGPIPRGFTSGLETIDLSNNMLSGRISPDIGKFSGLRYVDIGGNVLEGEIPSSITNISSLQFLTLASNQLTGEIPKRLGLMRSLKWIYLGYNNLSGQIPAEIGDLTSLTHLDLVYNNLTGNIPSSFGNLSRLQYLFLYQNKLTGPIPQPLYALKNLISLDLSDNYLSGQISEDVIQLQNLEILHLFSNNLTGKIPSALASLPRLQVLQLWSNKLSGKIPNTLGKLNNLTILDLSTNYLTGKIPESLCQSGRLFKLILFSNSLKGEIPKSLSRCKSLRRVRLQNNALSGELSPEFKRLPLVYFLDLSNNNLSGRIGGSKWEMPSLEMLSLARNRLFGMLPDSFGSNKLETLDLSENEFLGTVPRSFGFLPELIQLKLSHNKLTGDIPKDLSMCTKLVTLDLSHNQLSGQISSKFSDMPALGHLDLSDNELSGQIPEKLGCVDSLVEVNISHNHLRGNLPSTGAFLVINASSVAGNHLCGGATASGLPPCKNSNNSAWMVVAGALVVLALALATCMIVLVWRRNRSMLKRVENESGSWEMRYFDSKVLNSITVDDVLSSVRQKNVMSGRKDGVVSYRGEAMTSAMQFEVKELKVDSISASRIAELGKVKHPNVVNLIGICLSSKCGYLVYEYRNAKNLSEVVGTLSWARTQKIAQGIAKAMRFLHCNCSPPVVIGGLSPETVTVDENYCPRLILGLPMLSSVDTKGFISSASVAPETNKGMGVTEKSDIYGFGLILIQLLTGKTPTAVEFGVYDNIVEWARYCYSDCHLDAWIDPIFKENTLSNANEMVETMHLALRCTNADPTARPCSSDVYKTLESILRAPINCVSSLTFSSHI